MRPLTLQEVGSAISVVLLTHDVSWTERLEDSKEVQESGDFLDPNPARLPWVIFFSHHFSVHT